MQSNNKKTVLILVLSIIISIFSACSGTVTSKPEIKTSEYPPAPTNLMQATLTKLDGSGFKLDDYKGKVLLVNVWATYCGPCIDEIPKFVELQDKYKDKGFEVIGLNLHYEDTPQVIKDFGKELNVNYDLVKGDEKLFDEFVKVSKRPAIPQSFLIDREGKLLGVFVGGGSSLKKLIDSVNKVVGG